MELTFDQYKSVVHEYIEEYCVEKGVRKGTLQQKRNLHKRLSAFLNGRTFNLENVKAFQQHLYKNGCNEQSSRARHSTELRAFVNWCYKYKDLFEKNWSFKIVKPNVPKRKWNLLSEEMALKVINEGCIPNPNDNSRIRKAKEEHRLALQFMLLHGCRVGEVIKLKVSDLRLDAENPYVIIREPKNGEDRWQSIHSHFLPILRERIKERLGNYTLCQVPNYLNKRSKACFLI